MHKMLIPLLLGLSACSGGESEYLWGEASQTLSNDWCEVRERCLAYDEYERCWRHNMHHLCELDETCEVPVPAAESVAALCSAELAEINSNNQTGCIGVLYGVIPPTCGQLIDMMPSAHKGGGK